MKCDLILAGVGGQGVLSIGAIIASTSLRRGFHVKQSEVHGMSQRGGEVQAHLRLSDKPIHSDLIPRGAATLIVSLEPLESLRYLDFLSAEGVLLTSTDPVLNMASYPEQQALLETISGLPFAILVDAAGLAREAGSALACNMVMVGAASHHLPIAPATLESYIAEAFEHKGDKVVQINLRAFRLGRVAVEARSA